MIPAPSPGLGLCACGCGEATTLARQTDLARGYVRGTPARFVHGHHTRLRRTANAQALAAALAPQPALSATPSITPVPPGIRRDVHLKFLAVVERAFEREQLPPAIFRPDDEDG